MAGHSPGHLLFDPPHRLSPPHPEERRFSGASRRIEAAPSFETPRKRAAPQDEAAGKPQRSLRVMPAHDAAIETTLRADGSALRGHDPRGRRMAIRAEMGRLPL